MNDKRHLVWLAALAIPALLLAAFWVPRTTYADGNGDLGQSARFILHGNVVSAGVGLRGAGSGTIMLDGIPEGADVIQSYLYWATIGSANTYTSPTLDGFDVNGKLIGTSANTCWSNALNNFVYRADVTGLVTEDGAYTIAGLPDNLAAGNDSQGASLVVIYSDTSDPIRTIVINDGAVTLDLLTHEHTDTIASFNPDDPVTEAEVTYLVGDGQSIWDNGNVTFNGESIAENVFTGSDGDYWGTLSFDVTDLSPDSPSSTTINNNDPGNPDSPDCLLWAATVFSITAEMPADVNELSESATHLVHGDVTSSGVGLRGSGTGDITVSGIPAGANVSQAYLYWATIGNDGSFSSPTLDDFEVDGELIGQSGDTCWGAEHNFTYRADVTDLIDNNGTYTIAGLPDDLISGNDSQGASLVIVYTTSIEQPLRWVIINDGAVTLDLVENTHTDTIAGFTKDDPLSSARVTYLVGDGQSMWDNGNVSFEGASIANNVFNGSDGEHWGTLTFDVTALDPPDPSTTTIDNTPPEGSPDCLLWTATVFSITAPQPEYDNFIYAPLVANTEN